MESIHTSKYKRPVKYGAIPLKLPHSKGEYHTFTGLKNQFELQGSLIDDILPQDNELIKLKKALNRESINKECFPPRRSSASKKTDKLLKDCSQKLLSLA